jgi:tetratricopeptide (TPR) repeat protein
MKTINLFTIFLSLLLGSSPVIAKEKKESSYNSVSGTDWETRDSLEGITKHIDQLNEMVKRNPTSAEVHWKLSRAYHFYEAAYVDPDNIKLRKKIIGRAIQEAEKAVEISSESIDGHYWLALNYIKWSEVASNLAVLAYFDKIVQELDRVIQLDADFKQGSVYAWKAKVLYEMSPFPARISNKKKAKELISKSIQFGPDNGFNYLVWGEILSTEKNYGAAKTVIKKALSLPMNADLTTIKDLEKLLKKVNEKLI